MKITTDAVNTVELASAEDRIVTGLAVPYGRVTARTALGRQVFAPGAFAASVAHWMSRGDGARSPFRPRHGERPVGSIIELSDASDGVHFKARIRSGPRGDEYLADVADGLNGVSVEASLPEDIRRNKQGVVVWESAELTGIAGADSPAFDSARAALMKSEEINMAELSADEPQAEAAPAQLAPIITQHEATVADPVIRAVERSPISITREPNIYGRASGQSFLRDVYAAKTGDAAAIDRQNRHYAQAHDVSVAIERMGDAAYASDVLSSEIPGAYPNDYIPGLLTPRILKGRPMGSFFARQPITDATPKIFAKVTTSGSVAVQSAEGAALTATDIATTAVTATPLMYGTYTDVSRQVIDGADPNAQNLVLQDLIEGYAQASETVIKTAVEAGATASGTAITAATPFAGALGNIIKYQTTRFRPAEGQFIPSALFAVLLAQGDTTGRPFMPLLNPMNSDATVAAGAVSGSILGATAFLSYASTTNVVVTARKIDYVIYESSVATFSFAEVVGPQAVRIGVWAYLVVGTRLGGLSVTAA